LVDAGLLVMRTPTTTSAVRTTHALARAAIYQSIPYPRQRELHLAASNESTIGMERLEHRVAAADQYDAELAEELRLAGEVAHTAGEFRRASQLVRWSSELTADPSTRNRRWLDAVFDLVLARDMAAVRLQLAAVQSAQDLPRRALIQGLVAGVEKRWLDASVAYTSVSDDDLAGADSITRYRLLVLTAWATICAGHPLESLAGLLERAAAEPSPDAALAGNRIFSTGTMRLWRGDDGYLNEVTQAAPDIPAQTPVTSTYDLAWRGSNYAAWGHAKQAEADLLEVTTRFRAGVADNGDGVYQGLLAFARWQRGTWSLAAIDIGIALDRAVGQPHPENRAIEPLLLTVRGELDLADRKLREAEDVLTVMPWRKAVQLYVVSYTARLHAGHDDGARRAGLAHLDAVFGQALEIAGFTGPLWIVHLALAAIWAGDLPRAETLIEEATVQPNPPDWVAWVIAWLHGLVAEARGLDVLADRELDSAISGFTDDLPLYRAHVLADRARLAQRQNDNEAASRSQHAALAIYRELGAAPYLDSQVDGEIPDQRSPTAATDVLAPLSDRERDVATLVVNGLSYAQVANELFITRATVGFHLTRIYAKTNVTSRHELTDLVRRAST
jgi:DNA-binding CsgD family transcriptional regulator